MYIYIYIYMYIYIYICVCRLYTVYLYYIYIGWNVLDAIGFFLLQFPKPSSSPPCSKDKENMEEPRRPEWLGAAGPQMGMGLLIGGLGHVLFSIIYGNYMG